MRKDLRDEELHALINRLERFAKLTDSKYKIPGTKIPIGLDAILGFIPVIGEIVGLIMSLYLVAEARKIGAPVSLKLRMVANILIDFVIGLIPVVGDIADIGFRSNIRNMKLLVKHIQDERTKLNAPETAKSNISLLVGGLIIVCLIATLSLIMSL